MVNMCKNRTWYGPTQDTHKAHQRPKPGLRKEKAGEVVSISKISTKISPCPTMKGLQLISELYRNYLNIFQELK